MKKRKRVTFADQKIINQSSENNEEASLLILSDRLDEQENPERNADGYYESCSDAELSNQDGADS